MNSSSYEGVPVVKLRHAVRLYDDRDISWPQVASMLRVDLDQLLTALAAWPEMPPPPQ